MIAPRLWQVSLRTNAEGEEAAVGLLERTLGLAPSVYCNALNGEVIVTVYAEGLPSPLRTIQEQLQDSCMELFRAGCNGGHATVVIKPLRRENWAESWKRHFRPIEIGRRLLIKPSWSRQRAQRGQRVVILDPGLSFGTGHHPTTLFCLRQMVRCRLRGAQQSFLDIGSGSGILAIAAAKLGYSPVTAFDFDAEAVRAARQNIKRNKARVTLRRADLTRLPLIPRERRYDVICANLIGDLLMQEAEKIRNLLKPGGKLVIAGVLEREFLSVQNILRDFNLTLERSAVRLDWKSGQLALLQS